MNSASDFEREYEREGSRPTLLHSGLYFGTVEDVDDPEQRNRVRVRIHPLQDEVGPDGKSLGAASTTLPTAYLAWAQVVGIFGGKANEGAFFTPSVGSQVVVGFLHGNTAYPVVLGSAYSAPAKQPTIPVEARTGPSTMKPPADPNTNALDGGQVDEHVYTIRAPNGARVTINANPGLETVTIESSAGHAHTFRIDDVNDRVEILTNGGHVVEIDDQRSYIEIEARGLTAVPGASPHRIRLDRSKQSIEVETSRGYFIELVDTVVAEQGAYGLPTLVEGIYVRTPTGNQSVRISELARSIEARDDWNPLCPVVLRMTGLSLVPPALNQAYAEEILLSVGYAVSVRLTPTKIQFNAPIIEFGGFNPLGTLPGGGAIPAWQQDAATGVVIRGKYVYIHGDEHVRFSTDEFSQPSNANTLNTGVLFTNPNGEIVLNTHKHNSNGQNRPSNGGT